MLTTTSITIMTIPTIMIITTIAIIMRDAVAGDRATGRQRGREQAQKAQDTGRGIIDDASDTASGIVQDLRDKVWLQGLSQLMAAALQTWLLLCSSIVSHVLLFLEQRSRAASGYRGSCRDA